jgi:hypothetical protein
VKGEAAGSGFSFDKRRRPRRAGAYFIPVAILHGNDIAAMPAISWRMACTEKQSAMGFKKHYTVGFTGAKR